MSSDLYGELGISRGADTSEIKSAYRRLARQYHPDVNPDPASAQRFARVNEAYHVLSDPARRDWYDQTGTLDGVNLINKNRQPSAETMRTARRAYYQARADRIVNDWLERERTETKARGKAVYTIVTLFLSTFIMAMVKPNLFDVAATWLRIVLIGLFLLGVWHLITSLKEHFDYYTYPAPRRTRSRKRKDDARFKRGIAWAFVIGGYLVSLGAGLLLDALTNVSTELFGPEAGEALFPILFYPPIAVLIVDMIYRINLRLEEL
ncbi:MAG: J domain-containing protein [Acidobacteria bacterium]|nr:J domain-containing protein [Acidobacteriota bacterium]